MSSTPEAPPLDEARQQMLSTLHTSLGNDVVAHQSNHGDLVVRVQPRAWRRAAEVAKDELGCDYFCFLSGIDWMPNPDLSGEKAHDPVDELVSASDETAPSSGSLPADANVRSPDSSPSLSSESNEGALTQAETEAVVAEPVVVPTESSSSGYVTGAAGGETRFQVFARLYSTDKKVGVTLKADLDEQQPEIESWTSVYRGADWHERETWEMYGFQFRGHPSLRHIYLPGEFEGYPLRKDFPLLAREVKPWPGLVDVEPLPPGADGDAEGEESS